MTSPPYRPTRICPHHWCPRLHMLNAVFGLVFITQILFTGIISVLFTVLVAAIGVGIQTLVHGKSPTEMATQEAMAQAVGVHLVVRPVWAGIAAAMDGLMVLFDAAAVSLLFSHPGHANTPGASVAGITALVIAFGMLGFWNFAHRQATRPAKPKRVLLPALTASR